MKTFVCDACGNVCVVASGDKEIPTECPMKYGQAMFQKVAEKKEDSNVDTKDNQ